MVLPQLVALGALAVGGYFCYTGGSRLRTVYHILRNDPLAVRDLHGHRGPVEIEGRAVEGDAGTVEAPFTGSRCLAYTYEVEELRSSGKNQSWKTLDTGMGGVDFVVDDGTGRVEVDPDGADIHFQSHSVTVPPGTELPERLARYVAATDAVDPQDRVIDLRITQFNVGNRQRFTERRLDVGETVYVYGQATSGRSVEWGSDLVDALVADGDAAPVFVISDTDERGTAWRIARGGLWRAGLGLVFVGVVAAVAVSVLL
ncbi:GIDE domain-containing protein [Haloarcula onubensis]|uniref:RING-type E3 ubiquitin transferase n=1 Tax=Haloarcula onubensis TaxID=2950539 RepID=A0ABU2FS45_9EURY|nr:GIDE domain-containing protein [Halomicroarcula sp. S3CR25-11]MDS0283591.1 E3 ubiquitin ligase family protein [Halomicroarcula sp. S3CR25-11]